MSIEKRYRDDVAILDITGELIRDARFELNTAMQDQIDAGRKGIILNLEECLKVESVGLGMVASACEQLHRKGRKLVLCNVGRTVSYLIGVDTLNQILEKYDDEDEALESFKDVPVVAVNKARSFCSIGI